MTDLVASESEVAALAVDAFESAVASVVVASAFAVPAPVQVTAPELAVETATASLPSDLDHQDCYSRRTNLPHQTLAGE